MTIKVTLRVRPWSDWTADAMPRVDQAIVYAATFVPDLARWSAYVLRIAALGSFALAAWRFGYDVKLTQPFFVTEGLLSHWQTYVALTGLFALLSTQCERVAPETAARRLMTDEEITEAAVVWHARRFAQPLEQVE